MKGIFGITITTGSAYFVIVESTFRLASITIACIAGIYTIAYYRQRYLIDKAARCEACHKGVDPLYCSTSKRKRANTCPFPDR